MWVERLAGTTNVLRFPTERRARPTLDLMRSLAPDGHDVMAIAIAVGLDLASMDVRSTADAETAEHIDGTSTSGHKATEEALDGLLRPVVAAAIAASWSARDLALETATAQRTLARALETGEGWLAPLRQRAEALRLSAARLSIAAYALAEHAEGVARAVDCARRGEAWRPDTGNPGMTAALAETTGPLGYKATVRSLGTRKRTAGTAVAAIPPIDLSCA